MLPLNVYNGVSSILLSVILIVYLMIVELGEAKTKRALLPFVIVLGIVFAILAFLSIYSTYRGIK